MKTKINIDQIDRLIGREAAVEISYGLKRRSRFGAFMEILAAFLFIVFVALMLMGVFGCAGGRGTYTTLASTEKAVVLSYDGYVDSVIKGQSRTNELPLISKSFDLFQASFRVAVDAASGNTNAPVTGDLSTKAANLIQQITTAKSQPK